MASFFRKAQLEIDLESADDVADKLIIASQNFDKSADRLLAAATAADRAAANLRKACEQARLQAIASHRK